MKIKSSGWAKGWKWSSFGMGNQKKTRQYFKISSVRGLLSAFGNKKYTYKSGGSDYFFK